MELFRSICQQHPFLEAVLPAPSSFSSPASTDGPLEVWPLQVSIRSMMATHGLNAAFLLVGSGARRQYREMHAVRRALAAVADDLDRKIGRGKWLIVYGGDDYKPTKPDVAHVVKWLAQARSVPVLAVASAVVRDEYVAAAALPRTRRIAPKIAAAEVSVNCSVGLLHRGVCVHTL